MAASFLELLTVVLSTSVLTLRVSAFSIDPVRADDAASAAYLQSEQAKRPPWLSGTDSTRSDKLTSEEIAGIVSGVTVIIILFVVVLFCFCACCSTGRSRKIRALPSSAPPSIPPPVGISRTDMPTPCTRAAAAKPVTKTVTFEDPQVV